MSTQKKASKSSILEDTPLNTYFESVTAVDADADASSGAEASSSLPGVGWWLVGGIEDG